MNLLEFLACPLCKKSFELIIKKKTTEVKEGTLVCHNCGKGFPILNYIPRFVSEDSYTASFSLEWTLHRETLLDSVSGTDDAEQTFVKKTGFDLQQLKNKLVLDAGCGCGRFAEIVAKYGGEVIGVDLSFAVDGAFKNIGCKPNVHIIQADILDLPFKKDIFDYIFSIGVLHHTPDTKYAFNQLLPFLKRGGLIAIWVYSNESTMKLSNTISNFHRIFTTRLPPETVYKIAYLAVPLYNVKKLHSKLKIIINLIFPSSSHPNPQWRILDTFDWLTPR